MSTSLLKFGFNNGKRQKQQQTPATELALAKYNAEMSKARLVLVQLKQDMHDAYKRVERLSSLVYSRQNTTTGVAPLVSEAMINVLTDVYLGDDRFIDTLLKLVEKPETAFERAFADVTHGIKWSGGSERAWSMLIMLCNLMPLDSETSLAIDDISHFDTHVKPKSDEQWDVKCESLLKALSKAYASVPEEIVDVDNDVDATYNRDDDTRVSNPFNVAANGTPARTMIGRWDQTSVSAEPPKFSFGARTSNK